MTQEELYWYEKRLYMQADAKEHEIRDKYNHWIRGVDVLGEGKTEEKKRREKLDLELKCREEVELARLTILEPILDAQQKARLKSIRELKVRRAQMERERLERDRIESERREAERKRREEEEKRLAPIRAQQAAERERKMKIEYERQQKLYEEQRKAAEREENERIAIKWIVGIVIVGVIIALLVVFWHEILTFFGWILGVVFVIGLISAFLSS